MNIKTLQHFSYAANYCGTCNRVFLRTFDVNDPANPVVSSVDSIGGHASLQVVDRRVYVVAENLLIYEFKERPVLKVARVGGTLVLTWGDAPDFVLQHSASLDAPDWSEVPGSEGQTHIEWPMGNGSEFFRLIRL